MNDHYDFAIIGGGIVGLAAGHALALRDPRLRIAILEKETALGQHQTGRNSGVIHSGIYYKPGSFKAEFSKKGRKSMVEFCVAEKISHEICGKLIVATAEHELPQLDKLLERGLQNGLAVEKLTAAEAKSIEPHVTCLAALRVPETGITDYKQVAKRYSEIITAKGGQILLSTEVKRITQTANEVIAETSTQKITAKKMINCGGLQSDRVAKMGGIQPEAKIVPFRGEYYELTDDKKGLVKHLIYPVPNPDFPFLGVHFTRMADGSVHAGPNAVLALKREGYSWSKVSLRDLTETLTYSGFWHLASHHFREGMREVHRSLSKKAFLHSLQRLIPELEKENIRRTKAGVRAQAMLPNGGMVEDFLLVNAGRMVHVLNAPSPAATCSLEIGNWIAEQALK